MSAVLSPGGLRDLGDDVGDDVAHGFAARYLSMLEGRVDRLRTAVEHDDAVTAHVAALSLHSSSTMVGADALAEVARSLTAYLRSGALSAARALLPELMLVAAMTTAALLARV
ncbi:Hpt domain-containing protein [Georgenia sp. SYP-B2076]|uniref:Hpt domain-containing protein n=1 Tax=Georgenia sp. SYP-B2076 TaxID=2495881 RepID=UPI000F8DC1AD|nr:Hpt domain-containing protein [Georgenia sp. SYP-B2076]